MILALITFRVTLSHRLIIPDKFIKSGAVIGRRMISQAYCPDPSFPRAESLINSKPFEILPPLIYHIKVTKRYDSLVESISDECGLPIKYIHELLYFGGIYVRPEGNSNSRPKRYHSIDLNGMENEHIINPGTYIRVHVNPRRYVTALEIDWKQRVLMICDNFVIVNKPPNVPTCATVDNLLENVCYQVSKCVNPNQSLFVIGRLDVCTSGVVVLARNSTAAAAANEAITRRNVNKIYRALCYRSPRSSGDGEDGAGLSEGLVKHLFRRPRAVPKTPSTPIPSPLEDEEISSLGSGTGRVSYSKPRLLKQYSEETLQRPPQHQSAGDTERSHSDWQLAELEILAVVPVQLPDALAPSPLHPDVASLLSATQSSPPPVAAASTLGELFEVRLRLITGRTHQARLQLAALGFPVVGDSRYAPIAGLAIPATTDSDDDTEQHLLEGISMGEDPPRVCLHCESLEFLADPADTDPEEESSGDGLSDNRRSRERRTKKPSRIVRWNPLGERVVHAGEPWWRE